MSSTRRHVVCGLGAAMAWPRLGMGAEAGLPLPLPQATTLPVPQAGRLAFSVWRRGSRIGAHTVTFVQASDQLRVHTLAECTVGLGPITLYRYRYEVQETWAGGVLTDIEATTNDNGTKGRCVARREGERLLVDGSKSGQYTAPLRSIAGTHWNKAEIDAQIINPESGLLMTFQVVDKGMDAPPGGTTAATRYGLTGFGTVDLWYDAQRQWVGLRGVAKDKSVVEYRRA